MLANKSKAAFQTIAEVADELQVATHVLRFWETKFSQIQPMKSKGGRRYYRPDDVEVLKIIKTYLYEKRFTIEGVQRLLKNKSSKSILGEEIQKDFFEEKEEDTKPSQDISVVEVYKLNDFQKQSLKNLKKQLEALQSEIEADFSKK